jgi:hypothetical protein
MLHFFSLHQSKPHVFFVLPQKEKKAKVPAHLNSLFEKWSTIRKDLREEEQLRVDEHSASFDPAALKRVQKERIRRWKAEMVRIHFAFVCT